MQERKKVNTLVFGNCGFDCINNLEMTHGVGSLATESRYTGGYESWWNVRLADVFEKESVRKALEGMKAGRDEARKY